MYGVLATFSNTCLLWSPDLHSCDLVVYGMLFFRQEPAGNKRNQTAKVATWKCLSKPLLFGYLSFCRQHACCTSGPSSHWSQRRYLGALLGCLWSSFSSWTRQGGKGWWRVGGRGYMFSWFCYVNDFVSLMCIYIYNICFYISDISSFLMITVRHLFRFLLVWFILEGA